ncbi:MAG: ribonuclease PH [Bdellovibrionota bacterium]
MRKNNRSTTELRPIKITPNVLDYAEGSVMVEFGQTRVICSATYEPKPPSWLMGTGQGWVTAEYGMLPRSTHQRIRRDKSMTGGRTQEISRLIGRSLRSAVNLRAVGERQITVDCDVINADGGTRTAAVTGGFVAMALAFKKLKDVAEIKEWPLIHYVSAISVGLDEESGAKLLDLDYDEDSRIGTDMNFVMNHERSFIEVQGTAEKKPFSRQDLNEMMNIAEQGCHQLFMKQAEIVGSFFKFPG